MNGYMLNSIVELQQVSGQWKLVTKCCGLVYVLVWGCTSWIIRNSIVWLDNTRRKKLAPFGASSHDQKQGKGPVTSVCLPAWLTHLTPITLSLLSLSSDTWFLTCTSLWIIAYLITLYYLNNWLCIMVSLLLMMNLEIGRNDIVTSEA